MQFSGAGFRTGDYWIIPARTATGEIEWPPFAIPNQSPEPQPPRGIRHHYCRLALLAFDAESKTWSVLEDCRQLLPAADRSRRAAPPTRCTSSGSTGRTTGGYLGTGLANDGLRIRLDGPPDPASLSNDTVAVEVELPYPPGDTRVAIERVRIHLLGDGRTGSRRPNVIVWRLG